MTKNLILENLSLLPIYFMYYLCILTGIKAGYDNIIPLYMMESHIILYHYHILYLLHNVYQRRAEVIITRLSH